MTGEELMAERFQRQRPRLRAIAYRMLGSLSEAEDAVQETWLRLDGTDCGAIDNLDGWLTTVLTRVCLNLLRSRRSRPEEALGGVRMPEPVLCAEFEASAEERTVRADSVGLALLVVLESLTPTERLAFVLHEVFAVPHQDIASMIDKSADATRQLVSRSRRKVRAHGHAGGVPDSDLAGQREVVDAFFAAAHHGQFDRLVELMHPDAVLRSDGGPRRRSASMLIRGASAVARSTGAYRALARFARPVLVNGAAGALICPPGRPFSVMGFTVVGGRIAAIDVLADPDRIAGLELPELTRLAPRLAGSWTRPATDR